MVTQKFARSRGFGVYYNRLVVGKCAKRVSIAVCSGVTTDWQRASVPTRTGSADAPIRIPRSVGRWRDRHLLPRVRRRNLGWWPPPEHHPAPWNSVRRSWIAFPTHRGAPILHGSNASIRAHRYHGLVDVVLGGILVGANFADTSLPELGLRPTEMEPIPRWILAVTCS